MKKLHCLKYCGIAVTLILAGCNDVGTWEEVGVGESALGDEDQCGSTWDVQDVESYDGTLGVSTDWVRRHENPVGRHTRGCSGTLIAPDLFLSAGHCGYAVGDTVRFNYQNDPSGNPRPVTNTTVTAVVEQENNGTWDYSIVRLSGSPGNTFGYARIGDRDPAAGTRVAIIQHPAGVPKVIHTGPIVDYSSSQGPNWFRHAVDTEGGSSGSGVLTEDGFLIGVHTNAGCNTSNPIEGNSAIRMSRLLTHSATLASLAQRKCTGSTVAGSTNWQPYGENGIYVDIDTAACGFTATPRYFTSMGGSSRHWTTVGATSIYSPTSNGFRVYVNSEDAITPASANSHHWTINWEAEPDAARETELCTGATPAATTDWKQYGADGLYVDVSTSACGFTAKPNYVASLGGTSRHWRTRGVTSIYSPTATGFRVYVKYLDGAVTPDQAKSRHWSVNWRATPSSKVSTNLCNGATSTSATNWQQYGTNGLYVDVSTTACGYDWKPQILTSFGGSSNHWNSAGISSIYSPTATGFRVYVYSHDGEVTPDVAQSRSWHVDWSAGR